MPGIDCLTSFSDWLLVQNGNTTGLSNQKDTILRFLRNGRNLAAYTHVDVLFQAYFTALLVLGTIGAPVNPGNPYATSKVENGFCTFGGPDFAATVGEVAARALDKGVVPEVVRATSVLARWGSRATPTSYRATWS